MFEDDIEDNCLIENEWDRESTDREKYEKRYREAEAVYQEKLKACEAEHGKIPDIGSDDDENEVVDTILD